MDKQLLKDGVGWGFLLWFIGYTLGIVLFMFVPQSLLGLIITPFGVAITLFVLFKKLASKSVRYYLNVGIIWTIIAILFDYIFLVKMFKAEDYYKPDIYFYYFSTLALPLIVGWYKSRFSK
jgi:hypothetical protein